MSRCFGAHVFWPIDIPGKDTLGSGSEPNGVDGKWLRPRQERKAEMFQADSAPAENDRRLGQNRLIDADALVSADCLLAEPPELVEEPGSGLPVRSRPIWFSLYLADWRPVAKRGTRRRTALVRRGDCLYAVETNSGLLTRPPRTSGVI